MTCLTKTSFWQMVLDIYGVSNERRNLSRRTWRAKDAEQAYDLDSHQEGGAAERCFLKDWRNSTDRR